MEERIDLLGVLIMIEQYQSDIDDIKQNLDRTDLSKSERLQWIMSIGKLADRVFRDYDKQMGQTLIWTQVKAQVDWLDRWQQAEWLHQLT